MTGVLSVRKTLVLGIGTTGKEVCEQVAEHLTWQFGSFERASWVRFLVLETEQPTSILGDRILHAGIKPDEYMQYVTQPRTAGAEFGFYEWQDGPLLSRVSDPSTGAGNLRMVGRLCLFHTPNYNKLQMRVMRDIAALNQLTPQAVADGLGEPGLQVKIHTNTVVYVVGTLCGGTCSGGAADLGYLIDVWSNSSVNRQAIFTLPHPNLSRTEAPRYKKNAYHALTELNHYQLADSTWRQRLPGYAEPFVSHKIPYDILRVVMPGGPAGEDVVRLNAMIGQYLAAAVGPAGFEIAANDVNALNTMASTESIGFMRPLFSTMGVAALEYPGEHVQRATTNRLLATTLQRWCHHQPDSEKSDTALRLLGGTDFEALLQKLTQQGSEPYSVVASRELVKLTRGENPPRAEDFHRLLRDVTGSLEATSAPMGDTATGAPALIQVMQANLDALLITLQTQVGQTIERFLFDLEGGPGFVADILDKFLLTTEQWAMAAQESLQEIQQDARSLRSMINDQIAAAEGIQSKTFLLGKQDKLRKAWEPVGSSLISYFDTEAKVQALNHLTRGGFIEKIAEQYRKVTTILQRRLEQMEAAFRQEAAELDKQWQEMAAASPDVNGKVYFEPERPGVPGTVTEAYYTMLRQTNAYQEPATGWDDNRRETEAQKLVLKALEPLMAELVRNDGNNIFDSQPNLRSARERIPAATRAALESAARGFFAPLRDIVHIADMASDADIDTVIQLSAPKLGVARTQVSDQLPGVRGVAPALQDLAFTDLGPEGAAPRPSLSRVVQRVQNSMTLQRGGITNSRDPFRLLLIREKHGFTFGQMENVVRANEHDLISLQSAMHSRDFSYWHTRRDVDWIDPLVPPARVETTEEAWLLVLLLGRYADGVLPWTPANMKEIDPRGWYQITAGEFNVFYPEGTMDVSEREVRLPLSFNAAVAKLLLADYSTLRRSLNVRFTSYCDRSGYDRAVRVLDKAIEALDVYGVSDLDRLRAQRITRRHYRRNDGLTRAFFNYKTENMEKGRAEFANLWHEQGDPIPGKTTFYPASAYYCPTCNQPLGTEVKSMLDSMFRCPVCNTEEKYWP